MVVFGSSKGHRPAAQAADGAGLGVNQAGGHAGNWLLDAGREQRRPPKSSRAYKEPIVSLIFLVSQCWSGHIDAR